MQRKLIIATAAIVMGLAFIEGLLVLQPPTPESGLWASKNYALKQKAHLEKLKALAPIPRSPASVDGTDESTPVSAVSGQNTFDVNLECSDVGPMKIKVPQQVAQIRVFGKSCRRNQAISSVQVYRESDLAEGTVFLTDAISFTTDYMSLAKGETQYKILIHLKDGKESERQLIVEKNSLAKSESFP